MRAWLREGRRRIWAVVLTATLIVLLLAVAGLATWHYASFVVVPDHSPWAQAVNIEAVSPSRIELSRSEPTERPGYYGLVWQGGHAVVGPIVGSTTDRVTRRLREVHGYLEAGTPAGFDSSVYSGDPRQSFGLPFRSVAIPDPLGPMPAWLIPGAGRTWAIVVHGINDDREVGLRIAPALHRAGLPQLLISYRDDLGAPNGPDGLHHMGETEWHDVAAAVRYALDHGARRVVLVGYSMGGALIAQLMERSPLSSRVAALVLDAPALDWRAILEFNAERMGLPGLLALPVEWAIDARIDPDWDSLDAASHPEDFHLPVLLFHGTEDKVVPLATSEAFAAELPRWVTFYPVPKAGHVQSWNVNPRLYDRRLERFLKKSTSGPRRSQAR